MNILITILIVLTISYYIAKNIGNKKWNMPKDSFPLAWREILYTKVSYYNQLTQEEKTQFESKVHEFLLNCRITGIKTEVTDVDSVLIAASAIIPVFAFPEWKYYNLFEVLLYPHSFNQDFELEGNDRRILGMVGTGYMDGKMILSRQSLLLGFQNDTDKRNTAVHEFIHLIDKMDGTIDGIPEVFLKKPYVLPWMELVHKKMHEIHLDDSDIDPYAGTSETEFLTVTGEYFFERPKLLERNHPELYRALSHMFKQDLANRKSSQRRSVISRNDPCPCGSGEKFKKCCGM